ncbi:hypothetical protein [Fodinicola feengrottensis]|uniref:FxLD family lantipeptide n=1 Tax=Fodinicola feengrottensis TaxID=435914 RepID=A0ABN2HDS8_9ACTN|nr:hypothetical protein [Fodinicola feengrottensis]
MTAPVDEYDLDIRLSDPLILTDHDMSLTTTGPRGCENTGCYTCGNTCPTVRTSCCP